MPCLVSSRSTGIWFKICKCILVSLSWCLGQVCSSWIWRGLIWECELNISDPSMEPWHLTEEIKLTKTVYILLRWLCIQLRNIKRPAQSRLELLFLWLLALLLRRNVEADCSFTMERRSRSAVFCSEGWQSLVPHTCRALDNILHSPRMLRKACCL